MIEDLGTQEGDNGVGKALENKKDIEQYNAPRGKP